MGKVFFKGLNELRAIAAFAVIFHHIELFKSRDAFPSIYATKLNYFIDCLGKNGVYLFFVLSGFLITYLLISEKTKNLSINLPKFYLRRVFRIWPLFYLILIIAFFVIPFLASNFEIFQLTPSYFNRISNQENYSINSFLLYFLFVPNFALHLNYIVVGCSQTWSVGVEEQFYIVWPLLVMLFNKNIIPYIFIITLVMMSLFGMFFTHVIPFEYMAIGAIGGYFLYYKYDDVQNFINTKPYLYFVIIASIFILLFLPIIDKYLQSLMLSVLFIFLIIFTVVSNSKALFLNQTFSFFGKISYGIYMFHPFIMFLIFPIANKYLSENTLFYNLFVYISIFGLTILISHLSYKFFELKFIKYKDSKFGTL